MAQPGLTTEKLTPERWQALAAAYACITGTTVALGLTLPLLPLAIERAGYSTAFNGLNATTGSAALVVASFVMPSLAHRFGVVRLLVAGFLAAALSLAAFPFTPIEAWFPLRFILNFALQSLFVISEVWINTAATERTRGRLIGLYGALATAGFAAGPLIAAQFADPFTGPFLLGAVVILAGLGPVLAARRMAPLVESMSLAGLIAITIAGLVPILAALVHAASEVAVSSFLPLFAVRAGWAERDAILLLTAFGLGNVLLQLPVGWLADTIDRSRVLLLCTGVGCAGGVLLPFVAGSPAGLAAMTFVWGGAVIGMYTVGLTIIGERFKGARLAPASSAFALAYGFGSIAGPGGAGLAMDGFGDAALGGFIAFICGAYALILLADRRT